MKKLGSLVVLSLAALVAVLFIGANSVKASSPFTINVANTTSNETTTNVTNTAANNVTPVNISIPANNVVVTNNING